MPLIITVLSVVIDNTEGVLSWIKPHFGRWDVCCLTSSTAKTIFYTIPALTLLLANVVFCVMSAFIIRNNTMKNVSDEQKQTARLNFILYIRLGLIMGITWLIGIIANLCKELILWIIFNVLNSLHGLSIFFLFTCSRKVFKHIRK
ncbi:g-protein coupled receptor Mth2 [Nephila pilipes]|uniref:G-protein coupled receptor Mth2 n=1 Tax=Nephila pilipes TaxID=299642 RepID=A0A8X6THZ3_NEPPI|nr:g-protein coupled receptor Mth2 [Nephila pilipes]